MDPYVKQGYVIRDDRGGEISAQRAESDTAYPFQGQRLLVLYGDGPENARLALHMYDSRGKLAETDSWQKRTIRGCSNFAADHWNLLRHRGSGGIL